MSKEAGNAHQIILVPVSRAIPYLGAHGTHQHSTFVNKKVSIRAQKIGAEVFVSKEAGNAHGTDIQGLVARPQKRPSLRTGREDLG